MTDERERHEQLEEMRPRLRYVKERAAAERTRRLRRRKRRRKRKPIFQ
jgi:hypothetical protein